MNSLFFNKLINKGRQTEENGDEDRKRCIYTQSKWSEKEVELHFYSSESNKAYRGLISIDELKESASELEIPYDEFYAECQTALTTNLEVPPYACELDESNLLFLLVKKGSLDISYLEVKLKLLKNNSDMLDSALNLIEIAQNQEKNKHELIRRDNLAAEMGDALDKCIKMKNKLESRLLRKFTMLLNAKKEKIIELENKVEQMSGNSNNREDDDSNSDDCQPTTSTGSKAKAQRRKRRISSERCRDSNDSAEDDYEALTQVITQVNSNATQSSSPTKKRRQV